jgi:hypothetical protein
VTQNFGKLWETCMEADPKKRPWNGWISPETWWLIANRAMLRCTGRLCQTGRRCLHHQIGASLSIDWVACTANISANIDIKLAGRVIQEAFRHLKGWYRAATEMQSKPCFRTMQRQPSKRGNLYAWRQSPGDPLPIFPFWSPQSKSTMMLRQTTRFGLRPGNC